MLLPEATNLFNPQRTGQPESRAAFLCSQNTAPNTLIRIDANKKLSADELWALNIARQEAAELAGKLVNIPRTPGSREPTAGLLSLEGEGIPLISGKGYRIQGMEFPT